MGTAQPMPSGTGAITSPSEGPRRPINLPSLRAREQYPLFCYLFQIQLSPCPWRQHCWDWAITYVQVYAAYMLARALKMLEQQA
jgi:hypothetical protein